MKYYPEQLVPPDPKKRTDKKTLRIKVWRNTIMALVFAFGCLGTLWSIFTNNNPTSIIIGFGALFGWLIGYQYNDVR